MPEQPQAPIAEAETRGTIEPKRSEPIRMIRPDGTMYTPDSYDGPLIGEQPIPSPDEQRRRIEQRTAPAPHETADPLITATDSLIRAAARMQAQLPEAQQAAFEEQLRKLVQLSQGPSLPAPVVVDEKQRDIAIDAGLATQARIEINREFPDLIGREQQQAVDQRLQKLLAEHKATSAPQAQTEIPKITFETDITDVPPPVMNGVTPAAEAMSTPAEQPNPIVDLLGQQFESYIQSLPDEEDKIDTRARADIVLQVVRNGILPTETLLYPNNVERADGTQEEIPPTSEEILGRYDHLQQVFSYLEAQANPATEVQFDQTSDERESIVSYQDQNGAVQAFIFPLSAEHARTIYSNSSQLPPISPAAESGSPPETNTASQTAAPSETSPAGVTTPEHIERTNYIGRLTNILGSYADSFSGEQRAQTMERIGVIRDAVLNGILPTDALLYPNTITRDDGTEEQVPPTPEEILDRYERLRTDLAELQANVGQDAGTNVTFSPSSEPNQTNYQYDRAGQDPVSSVINHPIGEVQAVFPNIDRLPPLPPRPAEPPPPPPAELPTGPVTDEELKKREQDFDARLYAKVHEAFPTMLPENPTEQQVSELATNNVTAYCNAENLQDPQLRERAIEILQQQYKKGLIPAVSDVVAQARAEPVQQTRTPESAQSQQNYNRLTTLLTDSQMSQEETQRVTAEDIQETLSTYNTDMDTRNWVAQLLQQPGITGKQIVEALRAERQKKEFQQQTEQMKTSLYPILVDLQASYPDVAQQIAVALSANDIPPQIIQSYQGRPIPEFLAWWNQYKNEHGLQDKYRTGEKSVKEKLTDSARGAGQKVAGLFGRLRNRRGPVGTQIR